MSGDLDTIEQFLICPFCWQQISVVVDPSVEEQSYVEDCEVCCRPIQISVVADGGQIVSFSAEAVDQ